MKMVVLIILTYLGSMPLFNDKYRENKKTAHQRGDIALSPDKNPEDTSRLGRMDKA